MNSLGGRTRQRKSITLTAWNLGHCLTLTNHAYVNFHGVMQILLEHALFGSVRNVNTSWANEKWLAPGVAECGNVGGEGRDSCRVTIECGQAHCRNTEELFRVGAAGTNAIDSLAEQRRIADQTDEDFCAGEIRNYVWRATAFQDADIESGRTQEVIAWHGDSPKFLQNVEELFNGGFA